MKLREIDYYIKDLPFMVRQEIFKRLDNVNSIRAKYLLEKEQNYTSYRSMGLSDEDILKQLNKSAFDFEAVNEVMIENERYPIFEDPRDTYQSAKIYFEILTKRSDEELVEKFGCIFEEYVPRIYKKK